MIANSKQKYQDIEAFGIMAESNRSSEKLRESEDFQNEGISKASPNEQISSYSSSDDTCKLGDLETNVNSVQTCKGNIDSNDENSKASIHSQDNECYSNGNEEVNNVDTEELHEPLIRPDCSSRGKEEGEHINTE